MDEWGSEQVASNFVVANSPSASVLPYPRYACFDPDLASPSQVAFLHFVGTWRFHGGIFAAAAKTAIARLSAPSLAL